MEPSVDDGISADCNDRAVVPAFAGTADDAITPLLQLVS
jgi:hypothetical protein